MLLLQIGSTELYKLILQGLTMAGFQVAACLSTQGLEKKAEDKPDYDLICQVVAQLKQYKPSLMFAYNRSRVLFWALLESHHWSTEENQSNEMWGCEC